MNVNELMIGDFVYLLKNKSEINGFYVIDQCPRKVTSVRSGGDVDYIQTDDCDVFYVSDCYRPIPITPEILEKNGFVYDSEDKLFKDIYPRISMVYAQYRLVENGYINYGEMSEIKYVHELQHALKLCGIDKEIVL